MNNLLLFTILILQTNAIGCEPGYYLSISSKQCEPCKGNTYSPGGFQMSCKKHTLKCLIYSHEVNDCFLLKLHDDIIRYILDKNGGLFVLLFICLEIIGFVLIIAGSVYFFITFIELLPLWLKVIVLLLMSTSSYFSYDFFELIIPITLVLIVCYIIMLFKSLVKKIVRKKIDKNDISKKEKLNYKNNSFENNLIVETYSPNSSVDEPSVNDIVSDN